MKNSITIITCLALTCPAVFFSCHKDNPEPAPAQHFISAGVKEFGTDIPLEGAVINVWTEPGGKAQATTDMKGESNFSGDRIAFRSISKAGYWDYNFYDKKYAPLVLFPGNISLNSNKGGLFSCDRFEVELFPKSYITMHIKDSLGLNTCPGCDVFLTVNGIFTQFGVINSVYDEGSLDETKESILLKPNIDTTFQLTVFGNTDNEFYIIEGDGSDGFGSYRVIYKAKKFIPKSGKLIFNVTF